MSIHICKCEHNGRTEYHLRYPGMTQEEAQALADRINGGELVGADHPVRKDAERYRKLVATGNYCPASIGIGWGLVGRATKAQLDAKADELPAVGAA